MRAPLRRLVTLSCLIGFVAWCVHTEELAPAAPAAAVELKAVKYRQLGDALRGLHGKVVVVDVWGEF